MKVRYMQSCMDRLLLLHLLRFHETQSALQLPVFFFLLFFYHPYPGRRDSKSVFLILKILQHGGSSVEYNFFQSIHLSFDKRIDISISLRPMTSIFASKYIYRI